MKRKVWVLFSVAALTAVMLLTLSACLFDLPQHQHDWKLKETIAATCTEAGQEVYQCSSCGDKKYKELPKLGHKWITLEFVEPTCTETGYKKEQCERCSKVNWSNYYYAPHEVDPEEPGKEPTCTEAGYEPAGTCKVCHQHIDRRPIDPLGHDYEEGLCTVCGEVQILTVTYHSQLIGGETVTKTYKYGEPFDPTVQFSNMPDDQLIAGWRDYNVEIQDYWGGYSTEETKVYEDFHVCAQWMEYRNVSTAEQFLAIAERPDIAYHLMQDINLGGMTWTPMENFSGILKGEGHKIYNFSVMDGNAANSHAMIIANNGTIQDLEIYDVRYNVTYAGNEASTLGLFVAENKGKLRNCHISQGQIRLTVTESETQQPAHFGTIAAVNRGIVEKCSCSVDITCELSARYDGDVNDRYEHYYTFNYYIGGLIGYNAGTVSDSHYDGKFDLVKTITSGKILATMYGYWTYHYVTANFYFGGLIGAQSGGTVTRSYSDFVFSHGGSVKTFYADQEVSYENACVGGLVGLNTEKGQITYCFTTGDLYDNTWDSSAVAGLVATNQNNGSIISCHSSAKVTAVSRTRNVAGGLVGTNGANVQDSYANGEVHGGGNGTTGGFAGKNTAQGTISKCYCTGNVFAESGNADFFVGSSEGGEYKCYYLQGATVQCNGAYLDTAQKAEPKTYRTLWTDEFLIDDLYWDESGWIIVINGDPMLEWEKDVGHHYEAQVVQPTCEDFGYTVYTCSDCGRMFIRDYVAPNLHQKSRVVSRREAACEQTGAIIYHCDVCGQDFEEVIAPAREHEPTVKPGDEGFEPTCGKGIEATAGRTDKVTCKHCGITLQEAEPIEPHAFRVDVENSQAPDCTTEGKNHLVCNICGFETDETIPATGHTLQAGSLNCTVCEQPVWDESTFTKIPDLAALKAIADDLHGRYMLMADIDLKDELWNPIGTKEKPFAGVFYGNGHRIKNLTLTDVAVGGLFGYNTGEIVKLTVENASLSVTDISDPDLGVIAAANKGKILDCRVTGSVRFAVTVNKTTDSFADNAASHYVTMGGIAARNEEGGVIDKCVVDATIGVRVVDNFTNCAEVNRGFYLNRGWKQGVSKLNESVTIGGIAGVNGGSVTNCIMSGSLNADVTQQINLERVINEGKWNEVRYKAGKMEITTNVYEGSLVGNNKGVISDCEANGSSLNRLGGTQDDSSILFALTHNLNRVSNTDEAIRELVAYSEGTCTGVQKHN